MHRLTIVAAPLLAAASIAAAQDAAPPAPPAPTSTTTSARDLLEALRAAGVDVSSVATVNEDGSVTVKLPPPPHPAPGAPAISGEAPSPSDAAPPAPPPGAPDGPKPEAAKWDHKLTIGFGVSDGNTENANVDAIYAFTRELSWSRLAFDTGYFYSQDSGRTSQNSFTAGVTHDWLFLGTPWLLFADARYEYDEFQSWLHRLAFHVGPGYKLFATDPFSLTLRAGAGAVKEWLSDNEGWRMEGLAGFDLEWKLTRSQSLTTNFRYYPNFQDQGEYRTTTFAGWQMDIDKADGLSLTLGLIHEYQSIVNPGASKNDTRLFGGITFDF